LRWAVLYQRHVILVHAPPYTTVGPMLRCVPPTLRSIANGQAIEVDVMKGDEHLMKVRQRAEEWLTTKAVQFKVPEESQNVISEKEMTEEWLKGEECHNAIKALGELMEKHLGGKDQKGNEESAAVATDAGVPVGQLAAVPISQSAAAVASAPGPSSTSITLAELQRAVAAKFECSVTDLDSEFDKIKLKLGMFATVAILKKKGVPEEVDEGIAEVIRSLLG
jgi:hypothetical protein